MGYQQYLIRIQIFLPVLKIPLLCFQQTKLRKLNVLQNCSLCLAGAGGGLPDNGGPLTNSSFSGSGGGGGIDRSLRRLEAVQRMSVYEVRRGDGDLRGHTEPSVNGNVDLRGYSLKLGVVALELFPLPNSGVLLPLPVPLPL